MRLYLSATQKSSGKTTLGIGLAREFARRGYRVRPFKKGPDYIDPMWLSLAAGRACYNLDYHTMTPEELCAGFARHAQGADLCLIEGNVGLFDSVDPNGAGSNAELAKLLGTAPVLIVDVKGMGRGIAPLLLGYQAFDPALRIAGVVLNRVGSARHGANLRRVIEQYTDLPVLGLLPRADAIDIAERHLGLVPSNELDTAARQVEAIRAHVAAHVEIDALLAIAAQAAPPPWTAPPRAARAPDVRIGVACDQAFGFYYPDDLAALEAQGAALIPFSPLHDTELPAVDALLLGGGFPEFYLDALADNATMCAAVRDFLARGGPAYAECGGLMYLCRKLHWRGHSRALCGALAAEVALHERPQGRGYVRLRQTAAFPWPGEPRVGREIFAHEFHHSAIVQPDPDWVYAYDVLRGSGIDGRHDGIVQGNLLASYAHLRSVGGNDWSARFVAHVRAGRDSG